LITDSCKTYEQNVGVIYELKVIFEFTHHFIAPLKWTHITF